MGARFAIFQVVFGLALMAGAVTGTFRIRGFDYLPQSPAYRVVFFLLGALCFGYGVNGLTLLHR